MCLIGIQIVRDEARDVGGKQPVESIAGFCFGATIPLDHNCMGYNLHLYISYAKCI